MSSRTAGRVEVAGVEVATDHFIGGKRVASAETFVDLSPIGAEPIAELARGGELEAELAVAAATEAFPGWAALGPKGRAGHLHRLADLVDANIDRLAAVECADMYARRSLGVRRLSIRWACSGVFGSPKAWIFFIAPASSGFWRSRAAIDAFWNQRLKSGTFERKATTGRR